MDTQHDEDSFWMRMALSLAASDTPPTHNHSQISPQVSPQISLQISLQTRGSDVPVGCVITCPKPYNTSHSKLHKTLKEWTHQKFPKEHKHYLVATGTNQKERTNNPLHHAESIAISRAAKILGNWRLTQCTLYTTLEPCIMCSGAIIQARIKRVVFATKSPKNGGLGSLYDFSKDARLNHSPEITWGVEKDKAQKLLQNYFALTRKTNKQP